MKSLILLLVGLTSFTLVVPTLANEDTHAREVIALPDPSIVDDMLQRTNDLRLRRGLEPYVLNAALNTAAQNQANWLASTGRRGHYGENGSLPSHRAKAVGYTPIGWCCGENYYMSIDATPDMVWTFWVNSASHYVNLTHRKFTELGVGMATDGYRHSYVLVFGNSIVPEETAPVLVEAPAEETAPPAETTVTADAVTLPEEGVHVVASGDTLFKIGRRYGISHALLAQINALENPDVIYPGQVILLQQAVGQ